MTKKYEKGDDVSPTFCILPWIHLSTRPNGHMRVCCTANASSVGPTNDKKHGGEVGVLKTKEGHPANLNHTDLLSSWNNEYMKNVRLQMLNGEIPPSCSKCFVEEKAGHRSKRNWETEYWSKRVNLNEIVNDTKKDGSVPPKLYYVDLRLGSKCNLKCIMCSPHDSSAWIPDWQKMHPQVQNPILKETTGWNDKGRVLGKPSYNWHKENPNFWQQLYEQIPHMKQLYFAGGEPLIIEEHFDLLRKCVEMGYASQIELRYNSNGTVFPNEIFELWNQFERVRFHFSIDSIEDMNYYIRYPCDWETVTNNLHVLDNTEDNIEVTIACAVQVLNIYYLPDFIKWKLEQNYKKINPWPLGAGLLNYHFVYHPPHLNVKILPKWFKEKVEQKYNEFYPWLEDNWRKTTNLDDSIDFGTWRSAAYGIKRLQGMINFMNSEDWSGRMDEFREYIKIMDSIRDTKFSEIFPEMKDLLDE